jgi:hypothetical protein
MKFSAIMLVSFIVSVAIKLIILSAIVLRVAFKSIILGIIILSVPMLSVIYSECYNEGLLSIILAEYHNKAHYDESHLWLVLQLRSLYCVLMLSFILLSHYVEK